MAMLRTEIKEKLLHVMEMVAPSDDVDWNTVTEETHLVNDLGLSSVGVLYTVIAIEEFFDIRFENGFTQMSVLADAVTEALQNGKRVIVEHFDLLYPLLGFNANLLIGVGEQVLIARPTIFGPEPQEIRDTVYESLSYRLMAHTAEDLCETLMPPEEMERCGHGDVKHGFAIIFPDRKPEFDIAELECKVNELIAANLPITYADNTHISIDGKPHYCTGPRIHVSHTGQIENFHLLNHFVYDRFKKSWMLIGCVGKDAEKNLQKLDEQQMKQSDLIM